MTLFARYVFRQAAGALALILASLGGIVWIALALRELNVVTSKGQSGWALLSLTTLALPNLLAIIAPIALLIAAIHTLHRLNSDSELIVLTASGATAWTPARPLIALALIVMTAVTFVNHAAMPWSLRQLRATVLKMRSDLLTQVIQPGQFSSPEQGVTFHIRERSADGELLGLLMDDARSKKQNQSYLAERARIIKQDDRTYLIMNQGHIVRRDNSDEPATIIEFDTYAFDLDQFEQKTAGAIDLNPRERYYSELISPEPDSANFKRNPGQFRAELHERFSNPLYALAFVMIALAAVGQAQSTRQNRGQALAVAFVGALICRLSGLAINNVVVLQPSAVPLMYAIPISAILWGGWAMMQPVKARSTPTVLDRLQDGFAAGGGWIQAQYRVVAGMIVNPFRRR
jgi:lipopolysaccharide export system permease protein